MTAQRAGGVDIPLKYPQDGWCRFSESKMGSSSIRLISQVANCPRLISYCPGPGEKNKGHQLSSIHFAVEEVIPGSWLVGGSPSPKNSLKETGSAPSGIRLTGMSNAPLGALRGTSCSRFATPWQRRNTNAQFSGHASRVSINN